DTENANQPLANNFDKDAVAERLEVHEMIFDGVVDLVKTEAEKKRKAEEEAAAKKKAEEEAAAKKKAEEEAAAKKKAEEEAAARKKAAEEEATKKLIYFSQYNTDYTELRYDSKDGTAKGNIGSSGCGIVTMTMAIDSLSDYYVTPPVLRTLSVDWGTRVVGGTAPEFFPKAAEKYELDCEIISHTQSQDYKYDRAINALQQGNLVIGEMDEGHFTLKGHFVMFTKVENKNGTNWVYVYDPNDYNTSYTRKPWYNDGLIVVMEPGKVKAHGEKVIKPELL
ncbi:C39 family peptidase, partial [Acetonema longum]